MTAANRRTLTNKLGTCQDCTILSLGLVGLSLLIMSIGGVMELTIVVALGILSSAVFGLLLVLHAVFFFLKRKKTVAAERPRGCCGS